MPVVVASALCNVLFCTTVVAWLLVMLMKKKPAIVVFSVTDVDVKSVDSDDVVTFL